MYLLIYFCKQGEEDVISQNDRNAEVALVDNNPFVVSSVVC
jgi:hypothetical protein